MFEFTTETLSGVTYFTTINARNVTTMIFKYFGTMFVQVNNSPARALEDIKKHSKDVKSLLVVMGE